MAEKMDEAKLSALTRIGRHSDWMQISINRSGTDKDQTPARQWLAKRGLIEGHPSLRRVWRITPAGRRALDEASHDR